MHYYKFNIADWVKDTAHLSLKEEAILLRLFNYYVNTESCIPLKTQMVLRKLRIADESETVEILLEEFFVKTKDGWTNKELDKTISEYQKRADRNRLNGKSGGRPKNKDLAKPTGLPDGKQVDTESKPDGNLNHKPLTINQELLTNNNKKEKELTSSKEDHCPHQEIIDAYHKALPTMSKVRIWSKKRKSLLRARWREDANRQNINWWTGFFDYIAKSDFLTGKTERPFSCDLEWIVNSTNFVKIIEGKYHK